MIPLWLLLPLVLDERAAAARLMEIRGAFVGPPKAESMAALQELVEEAPGTVAGARALVWLGDLYRVDKDIEHATLCYRRAASSSDPEAHTRAARGLGDLEMNDRKFNSAYRFYKEARLTAMGAVMGAELAQKIALARKGHRRAIGEWLAWGFSVVVAGWLLSTSRVWRRPRLSVPVELLYAAPVYLLLVVACIGRDAQMESALLIFAPCSLALITCSGWAAQRDPPRGMRRLVHTTLLTVATAALLFAACNRAGIIDSLIFTVAS